MRRFLVDLGYKCHTPPEVFGTRADSEGAPDEVWLAKIARTGWVVLNRDAKIMQRPDELHAYRAARVHMFYLPGEATRDHLTWLVATHLHDVIVYATEKVPDVWTIRENGVNRLVVSKPSRRRRNSG